MKILSNDYESSLSNSKNIAWGGPGNFSRLFSDFTVKKEHHYYGIIFRSSNDKDPKIVVLPGNKKRRSYWRAYIPKTSRNKIANATRPLDPAVIYRPFIDSLKTLLREIKPDIILLNGFSDQAWALLKAGYETGIPVITQHAGFFKTELNIYSDFFTSAGKKIFSNMEKEICSLCRYEIFLNDWSLKKYSELIAPVNPKKAAVIPLPFKISSSRQNKRVKKHPPYHIGIVARWDRIKNQKAFLDIAIEAKIKQLPWIFHAITRIPATNINKALKDGYRRHIMIEKPRPAWQLPYFYRRMDLMVLPSHFDVNPTVVLEAAAENVGTLISPNVGWVNDFKKNGAANWVTDFLDAKKTVNRIKILLASDFPKKLIKLMINRHNPKKVFPQYLALFKKINKKP